ncbi:hypothetical protein ACLKA6_002591 [Drosophila palustris]
MFESKTPIIAVNNHRDQFMGLTHDDLLRCFALPNEEYICFDHQAVFNVKNRSASTYHTFVANRIAKIQALTNQSQWRHVSSANNAAVRLYDQSQWRHVSSANNAAIWLYGPLFLHGSPDKWTAPFIITPSNLERKTKHISLAISPSTIGEELYTCRHSNSFYKLQRIVAYMLHFCYKGYRATTTTLCTKELDRSRNLILRTIQQAEFPADLKMLQRYNTVDRKSTISSLSPERRWKMFQSKTPIIAVNNHRDQFMGLTHDDLRRCFALPNEEYICFDHQAVFNVNNRSVRIKESLSEVHLVTSVSLCADYFPIFTQTITMA